MGRYLGPICRLCRTEKRKLMLKGERCNSAKCPIAKKKEAPGKAAKARTGKMSDYGMQLREKQKLKKIYGMLEKQFKLTFDEANRRKGKTGENLIVGLETRLDNLVYRIGFANSIRMARQLVSHGHIRVDGKKVNIPSLEVKAGDVVAVKEKSKKSPKFEEIRDMAITVPAWMDVNVDKLEGKILAAPTRDQIDTPIAEHLIVELYSK